MPLACLTAVAGGVPPGPAVRAGFFVSTVDSTLGQLARRLAVCGSRSLAVTPADPADAPASFLRLAARCRWLAIVESGQGLAACATEAGQPGAAVGGGTAFSFVWRAPGQ